MKRLLLPFVCFLSALGLHAQQKYEFGLAVGAGNFTLPSPTHLRNNGQEGYSITDEYFKPGRRIAMGVYQKIRMGGHWAFTSGLTYHFSNIEYRYKNESHWQGYSNYYQIKHQASEQSLSLPVAFQFSFRKNGKWSLALGAELSHILSAVVSGTQYYGYTDNDFLYAFPDLWSGYKSFAFEMNYSAGLFYRIQPGLEAGLSFNYGRHDQAYNLLLPKFAYDDCLCYGYPFYDNTRLKSFSLSLRRNLLAPRS